MKQPRNWKRILLLLLAGSLLIFGMLRWFEHNQVFQPDRQMFVSESELRDHGIEEVFFTAADGTRLNGWFFPARTNSSRKQLVMLVCHGNAGNVCHRLDLAEALRETGVNVFLLDYRGYGRSAGHPTEEGTYQDALAAHQWLTGKGFTPQNILVFGESLGGGVAAELASRATVGGLILQSTFTSIPDIGADLFPWLPVRLLAHIRYDTCRKLPKLKVPVLVMHSRTDELVNFRHAERNFAIANQPKLFCEISGSHNSCLTDRKKFIEGVESFLKMIQR